MSGNNPEEGPAAEPVVDLQAAELVEFITVEARRRQQQLLRELDQERASLARMESEIRQAGDDLSLACQPVQRVEAIQRARREKESQLAAVNQAITQAGKRLEALDEQILGWNAEAMLDCAKIIVGELLPSLAEQVARGRRSVNDRYEAVTHSPLAADPDLWKQVTELMTFLGFDVVDKLNQEYKSFHTLYVRVDAGSQPAGEAA